MKKIKLVRALSDYVNDKKFSIIYKNNKLDIINYSKILDFSDTKISINYLDDIYIIIGTEKCIKI